MIALAKKTHSKHNSGFWLGFGILLFFIMVMRVSWLNDDAYITFRAVENFVNGYGPVYNIGERVQVFTHPLWMFLLSAVYFFVFRVAGISLPGELPLIALGLSWLSVVLAVGIIAYRKRERPAAFMIAIWFLISSRAFMDFSASGLENPLTFLLLALFAVRYQKEFSRESPFDAGALFSLSIIAGLATLNRMDTLLLFLPALLIAWWISTQRIKGLGSALLGFLPFVLWEGFSLAYYGFLFPNTAYAKLSSGIPAAGYVQQGLLYLLNSVSFDPLSMTLVTLTTAFALLRRDREITPTAIGVVLYFAYIVRIGGDYMSGRYISTLVFASVLILVEMNIEWERLYIPVFLLVLMLGVSNGTTPFMSDSSFENVFIDQNGISDERGFRYQEWGFLRINRNQLLPDSSYAHGGWQRAGPVQVLESGAIGLQGYLGGPNVHILDVMALADPLLARLPAKDQEHWRVGHIEREIPEGYRETLQTGDNKIMNPALKRYYDRLLAIISEPVFEPSRWQIIWNFSLGRYDRDLENYILSP